MKIILIITMAIALAACSRTEHSPRIQTELTIEKTQSRKRTPEEWKAALLSTYKESSVVDEGEGTTRFFACFGPKEKGCEAFAFGKRDAFRKIRFYKPGMTSGMDGAIGCPYIKSYISVPDNEQPSILLKPCFFGKNGWLFMNKIAVMVNGEVVLEKEFGNSEVQRNSESYGVEEMYDFIASENEINSLRKIKSDANVLVRITGEKGYFSLSKKAVNDFKDEIENMLIAYDAITKAVSLPIIQNNQPKLEANKNTKNPS